MWRLQALGRGVPAPRSLIRECGELLGLDARVLRAAGGAGNQALVDVVGGGRLATHQAPSLRFLSSSPEVASTSHGKKPKKPRARTRKDGREASSSLDDDELSQLDKAVKHVRNLMRHQRRVGRGGMVHEIIEVNNFGELTRHTCTDLDVLKKVKDKSFQFRDLGLLHIDGVRRQAELLVRERSIILRLFQVHAIIQSEWCMFFGANSAHVELAGQLLKRQVRANVLKEASSAGKMRLERGSEESGSGAGDGGGRSYSTDFIYEKKRAQGKGKGGGVQSAETLPETSVPPPRLPQQRKRDDLDGLWDDDAFEQKALQIALTTSISRLNHQAGQTGMLVDLVLRDIGNDVESLRKILPLQQKVEALRTDTESMNFVLTETLAQDEDMANMNLTWIDENEGQRPSAHDHLEVEAMLETSRREVQQIGRILTEINERIDDTREVLNISLDSQRNRILTLNLQTSLLTLSLTAIAVPAGILGMNIPLGLEEDPTAFPLFLQTMLGVGLSVYLLPLSFLYYGFFRTSKSRMKEVVALQNLVHDMDVIERTFYKMAATGEVSKRDFKAAMEEATGRQISDAEMELICKAFDEDGDDQLQLETYRRIIEQSVKKAARPF